MLASVAPHERLRGRSASLVFFGAGLAGFHEEIKLLREG